MKVLRENAAIVRKYNLYKSTFTNHGKTITLLEKKAFQVDTQNKVGL
jgi:hypothetical protein